MAVTMEQAQVRKDTLRVSSMWGALVVRRNSLVKRRISNSILRWCDQSPESAEQTVEITTTDFDHGFLPTETNENENRDTSGNSGICSNVPH